MGCRNLIRAASTTAAVVSLAMVLGSAGCAEPAFSAHLRDNSLEDIKQALSLARDVKAGPKSGRPTAYLLTGDKGDRHLVSYNLEGEKVNWDVAADVTSRVAVGRGFVALREGKTKVVVRAQDTGAKRCAVDIKPDDQFMGLAADTRVFYVTQTTSGSERVSTLFAVSAEGCSSLWKDEASMSMGAPAARGDLVAVPYAFQNVVFIDGRSGTEMARVRATDESVSFVRATAEGFFYGDNNGIYLFNERGFDTKGAGSKKASAYTEAKLASAQLRKFYYWDAYQPSQVDYTAFDRNRLLWRAEPAGDGVVFRDGAAFLHSFRYFFAFDAESGAIRWAYSHPKVDLVGSDDTGPSLVFVSAEGELGAVDAQSGAPGWSVKTGLKVAGATFDADGFGPKSGEPPPLMKTLGDIVSDPDSRFTAVKVFAVSSMATMKGPQVTAELVHVIMREGVSPAVAKAASEALVARKDPEAKLVYREALAQHADYLNDKRPHGADVLARVEAAVGDNESAPLLASHLRDPATPLPALKEIVRAIVVLGGDESVRALRNLLLTYRSDSSFLADPLSLELAADGLLKLGGPDGRRVVVYVAEEPRTMPALAAYIKKALADEGGAQAAGAKQAEQPAALPVARPAAASPAKASYPAKKKSQ